MAMLCWLIREIFATYKRNWLIVSIGLILFCVASTILNINEGRASYHSRALDDALTEAVSIKSDNFQTVNAKTEDYEGKLVHVTGDLRIQEPISDATYNIMVQAVKLRKIVQMYQWHEDFTESKFAEGDETARSYYYFKDWNEKVVDSRSFHSIGYQNPRQLPMQSKTATADKAFIGHFEIGNAGKELFSGWIDVTSDTRPEDSYIKMHQGWYFHVDDLYEPLVGDTRLKFQLCGLEGDSYTVVGKLVNGKVQPYQGRWLKKEIILLAKGELSLEAIFNEEHNSVRKTTWIVRAFGCALMFFAVIAMESLLRYFMFSQILSWLYIHPEQRLKGYLRATMIFTLASCLPRHLKKEVRDIIFGERD